MKLFVLIEWWEQDYEGGGDTLLGVFDSEEIAQKHKERLSVKAAKKTYSNDYHYGFKIEEVILNEFRNL